MLVSYTQHCGKPELGLKVQCSLAVPDTIIQKLSLLAVEPGFVEFLKCWSRNVLKVWACCWRSEICSTVKVKTLTAKDVNKYNIFDVIMPLPGKDVAFPGGVLGERYKEFLRADGLDPDNFSRKQK